CRHSSSRPGPARHNRSRSCACLLILGGSGVAEEGFTVAVLVLEFPATESGRPRPPIDRGEEGARDPGGGGDASPLAGAGAELLRGPVAAVFVAGQTERARGQFVYDLDRFECGGGASVHAGVSSNVVPQWMPRSQAAATCASVAPAANAAA